MDGATIDAIAGRLEFRATDTGYMRMSQAYLSRLPAEGARSVICIGCGTGVEARLLRRLLGEGVRITGVDHSAGLIGRAREITAAENPGGDFVYVVGDAHALEFPDNAFDIAVLHTVLSHVNEPDVVLREAARVTRPAGCVALFDGDYASITFGYPDHEVATAIEDALRQAVVANPRVMRDMPRMVADLGLELVEADSYLYADIGSGAFWSNAVDAFTPFIERGGAIPKDVLEAWRSYQSSAARSGAFFGASSYYSYILRKRA
jgi:ubiquinone/menaquinone biosynthesis C-methylase UbiE